MHMDDSKKIAAIWLTSLAVLVGTLSYGLSHQGITTVVESPAPVEAVTVEVASPVSQTAADVAVATIPEAAVSQGPVTCGQITLDNTQLGYYFWTEYSYYLMSLGNQIPATLDVTKPLSEQMYDSSSTWQDYMLNKTMVTIQETLAMVNGALEAGFELPVTRQAELDRDLTTIAETPLELGMLKADGTADVDAYLQQSYGEGANLESLSQFLYHSYLAAAYADYLYNLPEFSDGEIEAYYTENSLEYWENGVYQLEDKLATIRIILQSPTNLTDTVAWENAQKAAESLYLSWQAEAGNQDDFSAMAAAHSTDSTRAQGGLMTDISPQNLTGDLATWVFEPERQPGDSAVVKSETGWVIVYYVSQSDLTLWEKTAQEDLRQDTFAEEFVRLQEAYPATVDMAQVSIVELENYVQGTPK